MGLHCYTQYARLYVPITRFVGSPPRTPSPPHVPIWSHPRGICSRLWLDRTPHSCSWFGFLPACLTFTTTVVHPAYTHLHHLYLATLHAAPHLHAYAPYLYRHLPTTRTAARWFPLYLTRERMHVYFTPLHTRRSCPVTPLPTLPHTCCPPLPCQRLAIHFPFLPSPNTTT